MFQNKFDSFLFIGSFKKLTAFFVATDNYCGCNSDTMRQKSHNYICQKIRRELIDLEIYIFFNIEQGMNTLRTFMPF